MHIEPISPDHPQAQAFIRALDEYQGGLYPPQSNHLDGIDVLKQPNVVMLGAWDEENRLLGMGAVKFMAGYGEIKRMYVPGAHRKKGIGRQLLHALEHLTAARDLPTLRLETGTRQEAAIGLYKRAGFASCGPFGTYAQDPFSVFMEKSIPNFFELFSITSYTTRDRDQVLKVWLRCGLTVPGNDPDRDIQAKLADSPELFLVARLRDQVIGTCMAGYDGHRGWIYYLGPQTESKTN